MSERERKRERLLNIETLHKFNMCVPVLNNPALKKYGLIRPDFNLNSPNFKTFASTANVIKSL